MKKLLIFLMVFAMLFLVGCFVEPADPEPEVFPIVCEGGYYVAYYAEWSFTGCEEDPWYSAGTYWVNLDGRVFLIGDTVWPELATDVYGGCPGDFVEEIFR